MNQSSSINAALKGWIHKVNVTLIVALTAMLIFIVIIAKYVAPLSISAALIYFGVATFAIVSLILVASFVIIRNDGSDRMSFKRGERGDVQVDVLAPPQRINVLIVQLLHQLSSQPKPTALIPEDTPPIEDPSKFKGLSPKEAEDIAINDVSRALEKQTLESQSAIPNSTS